MEESKLTELRRRVTDLFELAAEWGIQINANNVAVNEHSIYYTAKNDPEQLKLPLGE